VTVNGGLCQFSREFPKKVADLLGLEEEKRLMKMPLSRRFREETLTDILMGGLLPFHPHLIQHIDFAANERMTGHDIEWEFVDFLPDGRKRYLRLHLQAKRAAPSKGGRAWRYKELDYLKGGQAKNLVDEARIRGRHCVPLYLLYHPEQVLEPQAGKLPAIEGVNVMLAPAVARAVQGGCNYKTRRVQHWRKHFMPLSTLLCWPGADFVQAFSALQFIVGRSPVFASGVSPDALASRLEEHRRSLLNLDADAGADFVGEPIEASDDVPPETMGTISGKFEQVRAYDGEELGGEARSRAIFVSGRWEDVLG
jgi:hypothetical protein